MSTDFDVIIQGGLVIDGKGTPGFESDIGIKGDTITAIADLKQAHAKTVISARDKVVTPGFIDMHSHSETTILEFPAAQSSIGQGITTAIGGHCGFSPAPATEYWVTGTWDWNWWHKAAPEKHALERVVKFDLARKYSLEVAGLDINWKTFGQWMERVEQARPGVNICPLVGHATVRGAVMGCDYRRSARDEEIQRMKWLIEEAMDSGAWGISNGMDYVPNAFSTHRESCEVVKTATRRGGIFSSHWRRTGLRVGFGNPGLIDGIKEAVAIAREASCQLQIAHLSSGYLVSPQPTTRLAVCAAEETLAYLDEVISQGVDLAFDVIPNHLTGGLCQMKYVASILAPWLGKAGNLEQFAENLRAPDYRDEIRKYIESGQYYSLNPITARNWAHSIMVGKSNVKSYSYRTIADIAAEASSDPFNALMQVIMDDPYARLSLGRQDTRDDAKRVFFRHPRAMVGNDTEVFDTLAEQTVPPYYLPNPNTYGGMARFLKRYALGMLGLEEGIRRITSLPASTMGIKDRGEILVGKKADIVVFTPSQVDEKSTDDEPRQYPEGFSWVLVNGVPALANGKHTLSRSGRILRR